MQHSAEAPYVVVEREQDGVLTLVRVDGAVAVSRSLVAVVDGLLDSLGAPARRGEATGSGEPPRDVRG